MFKIVRSYIFILGMLVAGGLLFSSCSKDFINDVSPTDAATAEEVFGSQEGVRVYFNGIYRSMRSQWESIDESAGGTDDAWGYNSVNMARVVKGKDIVMPYNSWYYYDYQNDNREPTYRRVRFTWYFFYELINQVNTLIAGVEGSEAIADADKTPLIAEARALRANLYFELVREFQFTILKDPSAPGVPLYTAPASEESVEGSPRGTIQQVFDLINDDIEFAVANLETGRSLKSQINLNVAWGLAARIYLEQGRWGEAATAARNAIQGLSLDAAGYPDNYNGMASPEVIWGFPQTTESGGQSVYYGTPSSFFEMTGQGYCIFWISAELVDKFSNTDIRNTFIAYDDDPSSPEAFITNKFGIATKDPIDLITGETVLMKTIDFNESLNMMRVGEMYLIEAEAKARDEQSDAADVLFELQQNRDPNAVASGNTGDALIEEILLERRKELYGELGIDWLDAKRTQSALDRSTSNHPPPLNYVIPANSPKFNLKIPQSEIEGNASLSPADQNQ